MPCGPEWISVLGSVCAGGWVCRGILGRVWLALSRGRLGRSRRWSRRTCLAQTRWRPAGIPCRAEIVPGARRGAEHNAPCDRRLVRASRRMQRLRHEQRLAHEEQSQQPYRSAHPQPVHASSYPSRSVSLSSQGFGPVISLAIEPISVATMSRAGSPISSAKPNQPRANTLRYPRYGTEA